MTRAVTRALWSPWRFVVWLGIASMLADVVYEGARAITGPYLASLGASAVVVGAISGAGEAIGFSGRLLSGPLADRTRAYWGLLLGGYAMTVVAVPFLGATSILWIVAGLVFAERAGKAVRRPAKDVILSHATASIGRGRGFSVHEALDQFGAVVGPLTVAAAFAITGKYAPTFAILAVPGLAVMLLLVWLRRRVPDPSLYEKGEPPSAKAPATAAAKAKSPAASSSARAKPVGLGRAYWWYLSFATVTTAGYSTFAVLSFHLVHEKLVATAVVPLIYAGAMAVDGLAARAAGALFDRIGRRVLIVVPLLSVVIPILAFSSRVGMAVAGILVWAAVMGIQESVMRAAVADLVPAARRGTAYGILAAALGGTALIGGVMTGALYATRLSLLIGIIVGIQVAAIALYLLWSHRLRWAVR